MATANEKEDEILLTVDIDEGAVEARLVELRKRSQELRAEKTALAKANKDGSLSNDDYAKSLTKANLALKSTTKEIQDNEHILAKNAQQHASAAGSINQMRAQVSLLYADWAALSKEERKNAEIGGVLKNQLKDLNDELKQEEGAVGDVATASLNTLSTLFAAQAQQAMAQLDKEQQAAVESAGTNADLRVRIEEKYQKQREKLQKENAEKQRKIASVQNIINTAVAVTKAFAENGPILGAIMSALAIATGVAQQSIIDSQTFALGGVKGYTSRYISDGKGAYVQGPGTAKSDSINARISNGESILTAKATTLFYD